MLHWQELILRLVLAAILGGLVGIERQRLDWAAGLRTHMLVCLGSALTMIVSSFGFSDILGTPNVSLDPSRVAAQVISGIGFLGAGTILFMKHQEIRGLTTAAGLWTVAAIGLAVGGGLYIAAATTTLLVLLILVVAKPYKNRISRRHQQNEIHLLVQAGSETLTLIGKTLEDNHLPFLHINIRQSDKPGMNHVDIRLNRQIEQASLLNTLNAIQQLPGVKSASLKSL
ncbi:MAG: MgtC/SapB family protein [Puia sp.]|nr:MgtC/SapB family protein [Puia sp.]